jgi:hypothetical protein
VKLRMYESPGINQVLVDVIQARGDTFRSQILFGIMKNFQVHESSGCIQKFPDWPLGVRTANGTALCH